MAKTVQSKKKGTPDPVNNEEDTSQEQRVNDSYTVPPIPEFITPPNRYEGATGGYLQVGNQANNLPPSIPDKYSSPPKQLLPLVNGFNFEDPVEDEVGKETPDTQTQKAPPSHPSDIANPYKMKGTPDTQTRKSPPSTVLEPPVNNMISTPQKAKANQTAIGILMTINHELFGFSFANCFRMAGMIGHIGSNMQTYGGEHFRFFTNLRSTWIPNSPLGGLDLWIVSIDHANDHLDTPFPIHKGFNYSIYMAFAKKIGRAGLVSGKIYGAVHYSVCHLSEREETDLATIIAQKAAERNEKVKAAIFESAPTNQEMEDLFN